mgnify:CR=1 FL=1
MEPKTHIGRKIEHIRLLKGMKQETLADLLDITQGAVSKIEQSENIDDNKLRSIAKALGVTADTIKYFDEDMLLGTANFYNTHFQDNATAVVNHINPVDKIVELYEKLLKEKDDIIEMYKKHTK